MGITQNLLQGTFLTIIVPSVLMELFSISR